MDPDTRLLYFQLFNEIGIIAQLNRALMDARLPGTMATPHFSVLNHLVRVKDGQTPQDLARAFQVPKTTMTHTLAGLVAGGLVAMRRNPGDGRSKCVWLTEEGRRFRAQAIESLGPDLDVIATHLPPTEIRDLIPRLAEIRKMLDAYRDQPDGDRQQAVAG